MSTKLEELEKMIIEKKEKINRIYERDLFPAKQALVELMNEAAKELCPFKIGERIKFENGKEGEITDITYFSRDFFLNSFGISPATEIDYEPAETYDPSQSVIIDYNQKEFTFTWQIEGVMINMDGQPGKRHFIPKNPFYNVIKGNLICERKIQNSVLDYLFMEIK